MAKWLLKQLSEIGEDLSLPIHPLVSKLLIGRGFSGKEEIEKFAFPDYQRDYHDPFLFSDMEKVVERIKIAASQNESVVIFGDYDADGITSSAIFKETFVNLGLSPIVYIPDKQTEGYGMNIAAVEEFAKKGITLVITVDCGITSIEEVEKAREYGIDVIITDHHHIPSTLPNAFAIINPHIENCGYPFENLAGVGVAFKVVQGIYQKLMPEKIEQTKWMLDLVAIGTIADCVPLIDENRLFVKYGLIVLSKTRRIGLQELFAVGRIVMDENSATDTKKVSFYIAPRINAAGRVKHANLAYDLIVENDVVKARDLALELEGSNTHRQKITEQVTNEIKLLAQNSFKDKKFIFAISENYPIGIVGLVAGKIAQQFNKPTAVFQKSESISKGSFRSIPQINIIETIGECRELLVKYGGHVQAAGVSIKNEQLESFYEKMNSLLESKLEGLDMEEEIVIDGQLDSAELDFLLLDGLEKLRPFGEGNSEPVFLMKDLVVRTVKAVGGSGKHIKLLLSPADGSPKIFEAISFNGAEKFSFIKEGGIIDIVCNVQKDEWNGNKKIQLTLLDAKIIENK